MAENFNETTDITEIENGEEQEENNGVPDIDSKYRLILIAAQRSKQLQRGAQPRIESDPRKTKSTRIALEEIKRHKVKFHFTKDK